MGTNTLLSRELQQDALFEMESQRSIDWGKPLTESYAPQSLDGLLGLEKQKRILKRFAENPKAGAAILLEGDTGTGKTTAGILLAKAIGAELHLLASQTATVENLRATIDRCWYVPMVGDKGWHLVQIDEAEKISPQAMLALLSVFDGTACPPRTIFVLTCNSTETFPDKFLGRCLRLPKFNTYGASETIKARLSAIWRERSGSSAELDVSKAQTGSVRAAYQWLEVELLSA